MKVDARERSATRHGIDTSLRPDRATWHAILPFFRTVQLGVSEDVARAANKAWEALPNPTAKPGTREPRDRVLSEEQLQALDDFMELLRKQKWNI
jgi:hypothetical protein